MAISNRVRRGIVLGCVGLVAVWGHFVFGQDEVASSPGELLAATEQRLAESALPGRLAAGGETLTVAAASAHSLGAGAATEWAVRLYGADTPGRKAFGIVLRMLDGDGSGAMRLCAIFAQVNAKAAKRVTEWRVVADKLESLATGELGATLDDAERQRWRDTGAALHVLALAESGRPQDRVQSMEAAAKAPLPLRKTACKAFAEIAREPALRQHAHWLRMALEGFMREKKLTDPCLAELLVDLMRPYPGRQADLAWRLRNLGLVEQAEYAQKQAAAGAPGDPRLAGGRLQSMVHSGKGTEAAEEAEKTMAEMPYPGRREFRKKYYTQLVQQSRYAEMIERHERSGRAPPPQLMRHKTNLPTLEHEKSKLTSLASAEPANAEPWLALGDVHTAEKAMDEAAVAHIKALELAKEPLVVYMAWIGLAESAPKRAWDAVGELKKVLDSGTVPRGEVVEVIFLTGAAVGEMEAAVELALAAAKDEGGRMKDEEGKARRGGEPVMTIAGALLWVQGREKEARKMFATQYADFAINELVGMLAELGGKGLDEWPGTRRWVAWGGGHGAGSEEQGAGSGGAVTGRGADALARKQGVKPWQGCVPEGLKQKALKTVNARLAELPGWRLAAECAVEALPSVTLSQTPGPVLELVFDHAPAEPTDEDLALIARCSDACLAWIDAHPDAGGSLELLLEVPMQPLRGKHKNEALWPEAKRLFVACVNRAGRRQDINIEDVRTPIRAFLRFARKAGWTEEDLAEVQSAVAKHYPKLVK